MYMFLTDSAVVLYTKHELSCSSSALNIMMRYRGFIFFIKKKKKNYYNHYWLWFGGEVTLYLGLCQNNTFTDTSIK